MMQRIAAGLTVLGIMFTLISCDVPTKPEPANVFNPESEQFISFPDLITKEVSDISAIEATSGGKFGSRYGSPIKAKGVCWSAEENPTIEDNCSDEGTGLEPYTSILSDLKPSTTYFVRAYLINDSGTLYGSNQSFTTRDGIVARATVDVESIFMAEATVSGEISNDEGPPVLERGVCIATTEEPTIDDNCISEGSGVGSFEVVFEDLQAATNYYVRVYGRNVLGVTYSNSVMLTTRDGIISITTSNARNIEVNTVTVGGFVSDDGGTPVTERGVCYSTSENPTTADNCVVSGQEDDDFEVELTGLESSTKYYFRSYATNIKGLVYGQLRSFTTCSAPFICPILVVDVTNPSTGRIWMDRNLGASQAAISSTDAEAYGYLFQWGRGVDGHNRRNSPTTTELSSSDQPGHHRFITVYDSPRDWRSPQNNSLWQGVNGINNPCPSSYRLPTEAEWTAEQQSWSSNDAAGAFNSPLKLPLAGYRSYGTGALLAEASFGSYWSSSVSDTRVSFLRFNNSVAIMISSFVRANGFSVRCIKD